MQHSIPYLRLDSQEQGIVHVVGPELGFTLPGMTIVCGDSHTSTHGAFGALAFGIGTSEVEHVLATQTLVTTRWENMKIVVEGVLATGVTSKDLILTIIGEIGKLLLGTLDRHAFQLKNALGTDGGTGMAIEFTGPVVKGLDMESRMTLCNMAIEAGARAGIIAADATTFKYIRGRTMAPAEESWAEAIEYWESFQSDPEACYKKVVHIDAGTVAPSVTWGTSPEQVTTIAGHIPHPNDFSSIQKQEACRRALSYMGLCSGTRMTDISIDKVFIGSCTNSRLEDLRSAAAVVRGRKISSNVKLALVVPGSGSVKRIAESEGLDQIFRAAGFEWRQAGCSMCVGLNEDSLLPQERCATTSNRNFENRQGTAGRTHLVSPATAAATAIAGKLADPRKLITLSDAKYTLDYLDAQPPEKPRSLQTQNDKEDLRLAKGHEFQQAVTLPSVSQPKPFGGVEGVVATISLSNVDTDCLFPKQFCTTTSRSGLQDTLFYNMRWKSDGSLDGDFVLNKVPYSRANILLCKGPNFGCGSSREHAVWALRDFGIQCVLAPSFGDIFYNNCFQNGILPAILDEDTMKVIAAEAERKPQMKVDLRTQSVYAADGNKLGEFQINPYGKQTLLEGADTIGSTLKYDAKVAKFEAGRAERHPWMESTVEKGLRSLLSNQNSYKKPLTHKYASSPEVLSW